MKIKINRAKARNDFKNDLAFYGVLAVFFVILTALFCSVEYLLPALRDSGDDDWGNRFILIRILIYIFFRS